MLTQIHFCNLQNEMTQEIINFDKECDEKNYIETMADDTFLSDVNNKQHIYENNKGNYVYASDNVEEDSIVETTALRQNSETSKGTSSSITSENYLILPGTLKRGRNKTRQVEVVLNMSREELELLELNIMTKKKNICYRMNVRIRKKKQQKEQKQEEER